MYVRGISFFTALRLSGNEQVLVYGGAYAVFKDFAAFFIILIHFMQCFLSAEF
jgi:hypothetical protein